MTPNVLIASLLMVPTLIALFHFARFPYVRSTAMPAWFLTIAVGFSPRRNLPDTAGKLVFEVVWLTFPGLVVGAFWASRGPGGRSRDPAAGLRPPRPGSAGSARCS